MKDREFLKWIHGRLIEVHGENENFDYMWKLRSVIEATDVNQETASTCMTTYKQLMQEHLNNNLFSSLNKVEVD